MPKNPVISETNFPGLSFFNRGKVRDIYDLGKLLIVSTDRLSAFDVVLSDGIPRKGEVLNRMSAFWFSQMQDIIPNHVITTEVDDFPMSCQPYASVLAGRSMLVKKAQPLPIECIVRGYLSGSAWKDYQASGSVGGNKLPPGLIESDKLPYPIFTPSTKAPTGTHDENINFEQACKLAGKATMGRVLDIVLAIYHRASMIAKSRGIIIADTKMEFGMIDGELILIDELLTPDSSRFWPLDEYDPGHSQNSFDKQFVRNYLLDDLHWDQKPPAPKLPEFIIQGTSRRYLEAYNRITGQKL